MSKKAKGFRKGRKGDEDEKEGHVRPIDTTKSIEAPAGTFVDVPKGMVYAMDTYVDKQGVLRSIGDDSCVVWHYPKCQRKGILPHEIVYDQNTGAPWCDKCAVATAIRTIVEHETGEKVRVRWCGYSFPNWWADELGNVYKEGEKKEPYLNKKGYRCVNAPKSNPVAHLILNGFVGPKPDGLEACHADDVKTNDRADNLRWGTHSSNVLDSVRNGTHARLGGEKNGQAILNSEVVKQIRKDYATGFYSWQGIADKYGISKRQAGRIINNESWVS